MKNKQAASETGVSMMELMVALVLFGIMSLGVCKAFLTHLRFNTNAEIRTSAMMAAQLRLDALRLEDPASMASSGTTSQNITIGDYIFQVRTTYCSPSTYCTSANTRHITVEVRKNNQRIYDVDTVFSQLR
jgi:Tfp pilus assembly protein PilV